MPAPKRTSSRKTLGKANPKGQTSLGKGIPKEVELPPEEPQEELTNREILRRKLDELTAGIVDDYGISAADELISRLELTIKEFNEEVTNLFSSMVERSMGQHQKMKSIWVREVTEVADEEGPPAIADDREMSEYEKRLERMEQSGGESSDEAEAESGSAAKAKRKKRHKK